VNAEERLAALEARQDRDEKRMERLLSHLLRIASQAIRLRLTLRRRGNLLRQRWERFVVDGQASESPARIKDPRRPGGPVADLD
jgi:hypothetical protein